MGDSAAQRLLGSTDNLAPEPQIFPTTDGLSHVSFYYFSSHSRCSLALADGHFSYQCSTFWVESSCISWLQHRAACHGVHCSELSCVCITEHGLTTDYLPNAGDVCSSQADTSTSYISHSNTSVRMPSNSHGSSVQHRDSKLSLTEPTQSYGSILWIIPTTVSTPT